MISQNELQSLYRDLYVCIRKYMWPFHIVEHIADLEIECYKAFPDLDLVRDRLAVLNRDMTDVSRDDEDMTNAFEAFQKALDSAESVYNKLNQPQEVLN